MIDFIFMAGVVLIVGGLFLISTPIGIIGSGIALVVFALLLARGRANSLLSKQKGKSDT